MLTLLPLLFLVQSTAADDRCSSFINGLPLAIKCEQLAEQTLPAGRHQVEAIARGEFTLLIDYECSAPSNVRAKVEAQTITLEIREQENGAFVSRGIGRVDWNETGSVVSRPKLTGGCVSPSGFREIKGAPAPIIVLPARPVRTPRRPQKLMDPPPAGRGNG